MTRRTILGVLTGAVLAIVLIVIRGEGERGGGGGVSIGRVSGRDCSR
jgi:hypothetical protein